MNTDELPLRMVAVETPEDRARTESWNWATLSVENRRKYGGLTVAARGREILAVARNLTELPDWADLPGSPPMEEVVMGSVFFLAANETEEFRPLLQTPGVDPRAWPLVAVSGGKIYGGGLSREEAIADARSRPGCPPEDELLVIRFR